MIALKSSKGNDAYFIGNINFDIVTQKLYRNRIPFHFQLFHVNIHSQNILQESLRGLSRTLGSTSRKTNPISIHTTHFSKYSPELSLSRPDPPSQGYFQQSYGHPSRLWNRDDVATINQKSIVEEILAGCGRPVRFERLLVNKSCATR